MPDRYATSRATLPPCSCDHDFWNGINFHLSYCPQEAPLRQAESLMRVMAETTGAIFLTHLLFKADGWVWDWPNHGGWTAQR